MTKEKIYIDNLKRGGYAIDIKESLMKIKNISNVIVNINESFVELHHDGENCRTVFLAKLAKMGYSTQANSNIKHTCKQCVNCAKKSVKEKINH